MDGVGSNPLASANAERFTQVSEKKAQNPEEIKKLSQDFEAIFLEIVLQSMLDSEYAKNLATQSMTGLASNVEEHLSKLMTKSDELQKNVGKSQYLQQAKSAIEKSP